MISLTAVNNGWAFDICPSKIYSDQLNSLNMPSSVTEKWPTKIAENTCLDICVTIY